MNINLLTFIIVIIIVIIIIILFNNKAIAEAEADNDVLSEQHTEPQKKKPGRKPLTNTPSSVSFSISCVYIFKSIDL